ncbi:MAG TPA: hypothetical protein VFQ60_05380 [Patescibacteria group bacterium]|nr:hypothetical protein [Patescibacteria group bacterium]
MKNIFPIFLVAIVVGAGAFFGGMAYGKSAAKPAFAAAGQFGQGRGSRGGQNGNGNAGFVAGSVLSMDPNSMTISLRQGGSKIVFYSTSTQVEKQASGAMSDIKVGTNVVANGSANSDGSITAQTIQIRPEGAIGGFGVMTNGNAPAPATN